MEEEQTSKTKVVRKGKEVYLDKLDPKFAQEAGKRMVQQNIVESEQDAKALFTRISQEFEGFIRDTEEFITTDSEMIQMQDKAGKRQQADSQQTQGPDELEEIDPKTVQSNATQVAPEFQMQQEHLEDREEEAKVHREVRGSEVRRRRQFKRLARHPL